MTGERMHKTRNQRTAYRPARTTRGSERRYTSERTYHGAPDAVALEAAAREYLARRERTRSKGRRILETIN
jgi:hypothetical protein